MISTKTGDIICIAGAVPAFVGLVWLTHSCIIPGASWVATVLAALVGALP